MKATKAAKKLGSRANRLSKRYLCEVAYGKQADTGKGDNICRLTYLYKQVYVYI